MSKVLCKICDEEKYSWGGRHGLTAHLQKKHQITKQEYYHRFFFKEGDGICKRCGNSTKWEDIHIQYKDYCSASCTLSVAHKLKWQNKEFRDKHSQIISKVMRKLWQTPEHREKMSVVSSEMRKRDWANPQYREQKSISAKAQWENIEYRQKMDMPGRNKKMWKDPEFAIFMKKNLSERSKKRWAEDSAFREKMTMTAINTLQGDNNFGYTKARQCYYNGIRMRSSWETEFASILDELGLKWEYEAYKFRLSSKTYMPDFYLPQYKQFIEVKPHQFFNKNLFLIDEMRTIHQESLILLSKGSFREYLSTLQNS